tara:strand:- start:620 stop:1276 length:657 start_codon:yes stop_codon:yes gene_type:complete
MAKDQSLATFDYAGLLASMDPYLNRSSSVLYRMAPKTARAASGFTGTGMMTPTMLRRGAMGVTTMGAKRFPLLAGGMQVIGGDPIGGVGTAAGGFVGAKLGAKAGAALAPVTGGLSIPVGAVIGGMIGGGLGQSTTRGLAGIDVNNPLTGPDISLGPIPLSQYAKTKKSVERAAELEALRMKEILPIMEKARQQQFQRDLIGTQVQMAGQLLGNIYPR